MIRKTIRMIYPLLLDIALAFLYSSINQFYAVDWFGGDQGANIAAFVALLIITLLCLALAFFNTREIDRKNRRLYYLLGNVVVLVSLFIFFFLSRKR